ncbi:hypothetical protein PGT21_004833 [Puccinia graminis f. sp. tritici]|uniref:Survival protein SurE-like phosphatase/nucleotidase domain-containing protein n=1 Tax=Puccinia graminis f. sp. tritici TaxID=56615 RepID=A0A5B0MDM6_PUCGR|nr:hypothetical protein PGTUg99_031439 [Puccinia graminis f. sp. tritici]KAA1090548.1 hypothetical protein PGT21_004833 [Puccinia graminis f. sp. tritici]
MSTTTTRGCPEVPTVLLTNDDGPCSEEESPFIYSFSELLIAEFLGSERSKLKVVIPDSQASWIGKSYLIKNKLTVVDYDPSTRTKSTDPSSTGPTALPDNPWKLVSGTPASCSNLGLFNLFPSQIDLVISGPNYGRNTSSAFSLSSGTVGAAMDAALSNHRAIALSYGIFERPISDGLLKAANQLAVKIIRELWKTGFGQPGDPNYPDLYSVNIPLVPAILNEPKVMWTTESRTRYARLFLPATDGSKSEPTQPAEIDEAASHLQDLHSNDPCGSNPKISKPLHGPLEFVFKPDISALIDPNAPGLLEGSDAWALNRGFATVTPLCAAFKPAPRPPIPDPTQSASTTDHGDSVWKL